MIEDFIAPVSDENSYATLTQPVQQKNCCLRGNYLLFILMVTLKYYFPVDAIHILRMREQKNENNINWDYFTNTH
jgi:hypothetical protein